VDLGSWILELGARLEGRGSRVEGRGSRVEGGIPETGSKRRHRLQNRRTPLMTSGLCQLARSFSSSAIENQAPSSKIQAPSPSSRVPRSSLLAPRPSPPAPRSPLLPRRTYIQQRPSHPRPTATRGSRTVSADRQKGRRRDHRNAPVRAWRGRRDLDLVGQPRRDEAARPAAVTPSRGAALLRRRPLRTAAAGQKVH
jgi:hypothetical protein